MGGRCALFLNIPLSEEAQVLANVLLLLFCVKLSAKTCGLGHKNDSILLVDVGAVTH